MSFKEAWNNAWRIIGDGLDWFWAWLTTHLPVVQSIADYVLLKADPLPVWVVLLLAVAAVGLCFTPVARYLILFETAVHEAGHGFVSWLLRLEVRGIKVAWDTSGTTRSVSGGRIRNALVAAAGYPAASFLGVIVSALLSSGYVNLCLILLWLGAIRLLWEAKGSLIGLPVSLAAVAGLTALGWFYDSKVVAVVLTAFIWVLIVSSWKRLSTVYQVTKRGGDDGSDMVALSRYIGFSPMFWFKVLFFVTVLNTVTALSLVLGSVL